MKRFFALIFSVYILFFSVTKPVLAQGVSATPMAILADDQKPELRTPTFLSGSTVLLDKYYPGIVFAAGRTVTVTGEVRGDLIVAANSVIIEGQVYGDLYAAAGTVVITGGGEVTRVREITYESAGGQVRGDIVVFAGELQHRAGAYSSNIIAAGETIELAGRVDSDVVVAAKNLTLSGLVNGNTQLYAENVNILASAVLWGSVTGEYTGTLDHDLHAKIEQDLNLQKKEGKSTPPAQKFVTDAVFTAIGYTLILSLLLWLMPQVLERGTRKVVTEWKKSFVAGVIWVIVAPVVMIGLIISVVGISAVFPVLFVYIALLFIGWILPTLALGQFVLPKQSRYLQAAVGSAAVAVVGSIPVLGTILSIFWSVFGIGAMLLLLRSSGTLASKTKK